MYKPSKLLITQAAAAIPASFSATTYQINQTLTVEQTPTFDFQGSNEVFEYTHLLFDSGTGNFKTGTYLSTGPSPQVGDGYDIIISLSRIHNQSTGIRNTTLKCKANVKAGTKALVNASNTQFGVEPLLSNGSNGSYMMTSFTPWNSGTLEMKADVTEDTGYLGVRPYMIGLVGYKSENTENPYLNYPNDHNYNGTKYLGFTTADGIDLYATLSYNYNAESLTDSVVVESFRKADNADEELLQYTEFVPVPESKQTAAVIALLAGSAALYRKRRKVA